MMESDADRLASIKALGGQLVKHSAGEFWAIFDANGVREQFGDTQVNSTSPQLTARSSDVARLNIDRATALTVEDGDFLVREALPGDVPGWHSIILDKP